MVIRGLHILFTTYLIVFLIGGGRVCGCEALSLIGVDVHDDHHHSDHDGHDCSFHHHEEDGNIPPEDHGCCELLEEILAVVPKPLMFDPSLDGIDLDKIFFSAALSSHFLPALSLSPRTCKRPPPFLMGVPCSLAVIQRFNV